MALIPGKWYGTVSPKPEPHKQRYKSAQELRQALPKVSSNTDSVSTFWAFLWEEHLSLIPGVEF